MAFAFSRNVFAMSFEWWQIFTNTKQMNLLAACIWSDHSPMTSNYLIFHHCDRRNMCFVLIYWREFVEIFLQEILDRYHGLHLWILEKRETNDVGKICHTKKFVTFCRVLSARKMQFAAAHSDHKIETCLYISWFQVVFVSRLVDVIFKLSSKRTFLFFRCRLIEIQFIQFVFLNLNSSSHSLLCPSLS